MAGTAKSSGIVESWVALLRCGEQPGHRLSLQAGNPRLCGAAVDSRGARRSLGLLDCRAAVAHLPFLLGDEAVVVRVQRREALVDGCHGIGLVAAELAVMVLVQLAEVGHLRFLLARLGRGGRCSWGGGARPWVGRGG